MPFRPQPNPALVVDNHIRKSNDNSNCNTSRKVTNINNNISNTYFCFCGCGAIAAVVAAAAAAAVAVCCLLFASFESCPSFKLTSLAPNPTPEPLPCSVRDFWYHQALE